VTAMPQQAPDVSPSPQWIVNKTAMKTAIGTTPSAPESNEQTTTVTGCQPACHPIAAAMTTATTAAITATAILSRTMGTSSAGERSSPARGRNGRTTKQTTSRVAVPICELSPRTPTSRIS
jgi:hypothetical protein